MSRRTKTKRVSAKEPTVGLTTKTETVGDSGGPTMSVLEGHVGATAYNAAYEREGWRGEWIRKSELFHMWGKRLKNGWRVTDKLDKVRDPHNYGPVTVSYW